MANVDPVRHAVLIDSVNCMSKGRGQAWFDGWVTEVRSRRVDGEDHDGAVRVAGGGGRNSPKVTGVSGISDGHQDRTAPDPEHWARVNQVVKLGKCHVRHLLFSGCTGHHSCNRSLWSASKRNRVRHLSSATRPTAVASGRRLAEVY